jgi:hypothetical protein
MSNFINIHNENYGKTVVTNGNFIAVSNINSKPYTCAEGFSRISEVLIYQKNQFTSNYSFAKVYRDPTGAAGKEVLSYYTEQSASNLYTASLSQDSGSNIDTSTSCDFIVLEDDTVTVKQSFFGSALAICDKYLVISDTAFSESVASIDINNTAVHVYKLYETSVDECKSEELTTFTLPDAPVCIFTGSQTNGFGNAIAVSDKYLAIGAPYTNDGSGSVYIYKISGSCDEYFLMQELTSSNSGDLYFGSAVYIDKYDQNKIAISSAPTANSKVFIYFYQSGSDGESWKLNQTLIQDLSDKWYKVQGNRDLDWYADPNRSSPYNTRYGYSLAIAKDNLIVGAPNDLIYYEYSSSLQLLNSQPIRYRGAFYHYSILSGSTSNEFILANKSYGDVNVFKDNMLGYSVDITDKYAVVGSPKPYFPFSSLYLSASIDRYNTNLEPNDFGSSTFNGQVLLYNIVRNLCGDADELRLATTTPIGYRKKIGEPFSAFGSSVALSDINMAVGSPTPLMDDFYLKVPFALEQSSGSGLFSCSFSSLTSSIFFMMEDDICDCNGNNLNSGSPSSISASVGPVTSSNSSIIYIMDDDNPAIDYLHGKSFIYDFADLQKNYTVGNVFYNYNKIVINNTGSILSDLLKNPLNPLDDYVYGDYQSQITLNEKQFICTVEPGEFNISTNPTAITSSFTGSSIVNSYCVVNKEVFDFSNLDIVLRYINYKLTSTHVESWWDVLVTGDVQESMFNFYTSSVTNFTDNRLTPELKCILGSKDFDVNKDGVVNYADAYMIWNYFIANLTIENYKQYITTNSKRKNYDSIIEFLDEKTLKGGFNRIKSEFFNYNFSASVDPTGSYLAPYITEVGLYSGADLVAIAKLASPIKNNGQIPINIVVKWDT